MVSLLLIGGVAHAQPRRLSSSQVPAPKPVVTAPAKKAAKPAVKKARPAAVKTPPAPSEQTVLTQYQRIGRDIRELQNFRGTECTLELWKTFRSIKLDEATTTAEARIATAATLQELQVKIDRKRGITLRQECLDNPLAAECQL